MMGNYHVRFGERKMVWGSRSKLVQRTACLNDYGIISLLYLNSPF